jgi:peptidyl-tRNA hydrolase, PTH1 family
MKILIGLGNPGKKYRYSRHNLGFLVIDKISEEKKIRIGKKRFNSSIGESKIFREKVLLVKPLTFMNRSGQAVKSLARQTKADLNDMLIICDDVNLSCGSIRIKPSGSAGGHKGLKSIIEDLETDSYPRLRIGIGTQSQIKGDLSSYVLRPAGRREKKAIEESLLKAKEACYLWLKEGLQACMNRFNIKDSSEADN